MVVDVPDDCDPAATPDSNAYEVPVPLQPASVEHGLYQYIANDPAGVSTIEGYSVPRSSLDRGKAVYAKPEEKQLVLPSTQARPMVVTLTAVPNEGATLVQAIPAPCMVTREEAQALLADDAVPVGAFVLRTRVNSQLALSLRKESGAVIHYRIKQGDRGFMLQSTLLPANITALDACMQYLSTAQGAAFAGLSLPLKVRVLATSAV